MSFRSELKDAVGTIKTDSKAVFVNSASRVLTSIQFGDPLTGAPGQPVDTGTLRNSWQLKFEGDVAVISTNVVYAPGIEEGVMLARSGQVTGSTGQRITYRHGGGPHSVKLTLASLQKIVDAETEALRG